MLKSPQRKMTYNAPGKQATNRRSVGSSVRWSPVTRWMRTERSLRRKWLCMKHQEQSSEHSRYSAGYFAKELGSLTLIELKCNLLIAKA
jgi:hypothetical protein